MELTNSNYYSREANETYMSASQFKAFLRCESAALAELRGELTRPKTTALLVGSFVDAYFEGSLGEFKEENPEIFKRDGTLKSDYVHAERVIERINQDRLFSLLMSGKKQVIRTGTIAGVPFKIKMDSLLDSHICDLIVSEFPETEDFFGLCAGAIIDLKIVRDFEDIYVPAQMCKIPFVEAWGYDTQGAIYQEIEGNALPFALAAATKEEATDLRALSIPGDMLSIKLEEVESLAPRFAAIKRGEIEPESCGRCPFCLGKKTLKRIVPYWEVTG